MLRLQLYGDALSRQTSVGEKGRECKGTVTKVMIVSWICLFKSFFYFLQCSAASEVLIIKINATLN